MAIINKTGIGDGNLIEAEHITRIIDSLNGTGSYSIAATGSFTGSFKGDGSQLTGVPAGPSTTASYVDSSGVDGPLGMNSILSASFATTASFAVSASRSVSAAFATTASFLSGAVLQNGNRFGTIMQIGTEDAFDLALQASGSNYLIIEGSENSTKGHVRLLATGSIARPALTFNGSTTSGIGYALEDGYNAISISSLAQECVSLDVGGSGNSAYPIAVFGDRRYFRQADKWGGAGIHVQNGAVYADGFNSNVFYSVSAWSKSSFKCGFNLNTSTSNLEFRSAPSSSVTGSPSNGVAEPTNFMEVDANYDTGGINTPNVKINYRLKLGLLWAGTSTAIGWDSSTQEVRYVSSDQRLKTDVQTITGSVDIVKQLNGVQFKWTDVNEPEFKISTDSSGSQIGLIAQQVQTVLPQIVKPNGFKDYLTVEYDKLVAVLIEAVKEQQSQIDALTARVDALENTP